MRGCVFHNVNEHWAGASAAGNGKRFAHDVSKLCSIAHHVIAFCNRHGNASDVNLLEGILAHQVFCYVAGNKHHRGGIHIRRGDAGCEVGAARARGGEAYTHLAGGAGIAIGRVGSTLLMGGQDVANLAAIAIELVIDVQDGAAGVTKYRINALLQQAFHQNFCACHLHVENPPEPA